MLSAACHSAPLDSECDPKQVPRAVGTSAPKFQASAPSWALCTPLSSRVPAIGSSPKGDISAGYLHLPSDTSTKNLPGSRATHGMQRGQTEPCSCLPSHRGLQPQEEPVSTHGLTGFKLLWDQLGLSAAEEGREELHMQGGAGDKRLSYCGARLCRASPCTAFCLSSLA